MARRNQHKPRPPDNDIRGPMEKYFKMGVPDVQMGELLKAHYDTKAYGLSVVTIRRLRKQWGMKSTRQQGQTEDTIYESVLAIRKQFPTRGNEGIRKTLRLQHGIRATREVISSLLKTMEFEEASLHSRELRDQDFWPVGVNDVWPQGQHDKWGRFGLWMHAGIEAFSGEFNWLKIWWTNKSPRLITKYYLDTCRRIGGAPMFTQSDPGTENYGVANVHTLIRHRLDPNLANSLQHHFAARPNNIHSEFRWTSFWRDFSPGFGDELQKGVDHGWYNVNETLDNLLFRWIAIPWLQAEIDKWMNVKNSLAPTRARRNKLLPRDIPQLIRLKPSRFNALDSKILVPSELFDEMEALYAPPDHPVFELVPPAFHDHVSEAYSAIGEPCVDIATFWEVYLRLRQQLRKPCHQSLTEVLTSYHNQDDDSVDIPLLPNMEQFRPDQPLNLGSKGSYVGGLDFGALPDGIREPSAEYAADFTTDEEADMGGIREPSVVCYADFTDDEADMGGMHEPSAVYYADFTDDEADTDDEVDIGGTHEPSAVYYADFTDDEAGIREPSAECYADFTTDEEAEGD